MRSTLIDSTRHDAGAERDGKMSFDHAQGFELASV
jgi:hypothetical protein